MTDPLVDLVTPITVILGLVGLGTFIWNTVKGYNKRQDEIAKARKADEEKKEAVIKKDLEIRGEQIRRDAIETASDVKREVELRAATIKQDIETTARNLREHNTAMHELLKVAIREVDDKVMKMLKDLSERASLTNGNVEKIRNEVQDAKESIYDVKQDIIDLWNRLDDTDTVLGTGEKTPPDQIARRKREQEFNRRRQDFDSKKKRNEIKDTSDHQERRNKSYYDDSEGQFRR